MLISTTLTGNSEKIIANAIESIVSIVDYCLIVDTGITDKTLDIAKECAGDKLIIKQFKWINDFATARNFSLSCAKEIGADWAITLDSDERIVIEEGFSKDWNCDLGLVYNNTKMYAKERIFRIPAKGYWTGPTHECFCCPGTRSIIEGLHFWELSKTEEECQKKFIRDVEILKKHLLVEDTPRWRYYHGESLKNLGKYKEAIEEYKKSSESYWDEEAAYSCFRVAECLIILNNYKDAVEWCSRGLAKHPGMAELAWLAGFCSYKLGKYRDAVCWSNMAISCSPSLADFPRSGFRYVPAYFEGPHDVLRFAWEKLGKSDKAKLAENLYNYEKKRREG